MTSLTTHFPSDGRPVLRVEGRAKSILLEHPPRSRQLSEASDADLAAAIAADYSLGTDAADGITREQVVTDRVSDWDAVKRRAAELGWVAYVRGDTLVMRPPTPHADAIELDYTRSIVELHLTQDLAHVVDSAVGVGWDVDTLEPSEAEQGVSSAGIATGDRPAHDAAIGDAGWPMRTERVESDARSAADAADAAAVGAQRAAALAHFYGTGVDPGEPGPALRQLGGDQRCRAPGCPGRTTSARPDSGCRPTATAPSSRSARRRGWHPPSRRTRSGGTALGVVESLEDPESPQPGAGPAAVAHRRRGRRVGAAVLPRRRRRLRRRDRAVRRPGGAGRLRRRRPVVRGGARLAPQRHPGAAGGRGPRHQRRPRDRDAGPAHAALRGRDRPRR